MIKALLLFLLVTPAVVPESVPVSFAATERPAPTLCALAVARLARESGVPVQLALRLAQNESSFEWWAVSGKGAEGLFQLMPEYHAYFQWRFNDGNPFDEFDAEDSARIGLRYLDSLYRQFGTWWLAVAHYNCGPNVDRLPDESRRLADEVVGHDG
jgi:soluble lytic murein transglycosylase-like protein